MKLRIRALGLAFLAQLALIPVPPTFAQDTAAQPAATDEDAPSRARQALAWSQERLAELDATIATLEKDAAQREGEAKAKAQAALRNLRDKREAYRLKTQEAAANARTWTEMQAVAAARSLDESWNAFQAGVAEYFDAVKADGATRWQVLEAELDAWRQARSKSIEELRTDVHKINARERAAIEARIDALKVQTDESKARIERLKGASRESWETAKQSYAETKQRFAETYASIRQSIKDAYEKDGARDGKKQ